MKKIKLGNQAVYWPGNVITLSEVDLSKITVTEKKKRTFSTDFRRKTTEDPNKSHMRNR